MRKRILSLLLCIVMCLSLLPTVAFAGGGTHIMTASTSRSPHGTVKIDHEDYGEASGTGNITLEVGHGAEVRFAATPDPGYKFKEWQLEDGSVYSEPYRYFDKPAFDDFTVYAIFEPDANLITEVIVTGFESIAAGKTAGQLSHLSIPEGANYFFDPDYRDGGYSEWSLVEDGKSLVENRMRDTDVFANGKTYSEGRALVAKSGYAFADDCTFIAKDKYGNPVAIDTVNTRKAGNSYAFIYTESQQIVTTYPV